LIAFTNRPNSISLQPVVQQIALLRGQLSQQHSDLVNPLKDRNGDLLAQILAELKTLGPRIEATGPRRNIRNSQ
jgi:hypothetical protein